jgi:hypothetical protein
MDSITFRTNDAARWGNGQGSDLTAHEIDVNFWVLYTALLAIQDHADTNAGIASFQVSGDQFTVWLTNHVELGPFYLPVAAFNWRGAWQANVPYNVNDVFSATDAATGLPAVFLVVYPQPNSGATFFQFANNGNGINYYAEMFVAPPPSLGPQTGPAGGFLQMRMLNSPQSLAWTLMTRNIGIYIESEPDPLEPVAQYVFTEATTFEAGLPGSQGYSGTRPTTDQEYQLYWNGANIGYVTFHHSGSPEVTFTFNHTITFEPRDVITIVAPSVPDPHMTMISITLVGTVVTLD